MSSSEVFRRFYVKLVTMLPMNDPLFVAKLFACGLLPGNLEQDIKAEKTPVDKATLFLGHRIKTDISVDDSTNFNKLLNVMEDSDYDNLKMLAEEIKTALKPQPAVYRNDFAG